MADIYSLHPMVFTVAIIEPSSDQDIKLSLSTITTALLYVSKIFEFKCCI